MSVLPSMNTAKAKSFANAFSNHPGIHFLSQSALKSSRTLLKGLNGSAHAFSIAAFYQQHNDSILIIEEDREKAAYLLNDLELILPHASIFFFPSSFKRLIYDNKIDAGNIVLRTEVLNKLSHSRTKSILISYPDALIEKLISKKDLNQNTLLLKTNEQISISFITDLLHTYEFDRVDFVAEPGQFSVRGSIVDIFSFSSDLPVRIDFFGDTVESIRTFEVDSQASLEVIQEIAIVPNIQNDLIAKRNNSLFDFLPAKSHLFIHDAEWMFTAIDATLHQSSTKILQDLPVENIPEGEFHSSEYLKRKMLDFSIVEYGERNFFSTTEVYDFQCENQPNFNKNFESFRDKITEYYFNGYEIVIFSSNEKQITRLQEILTEIHLDPSVKVSFVNQSIHRGFIDHTIRQCLFTDHELFERYHKFQLRGNISKKEAYTLRELTSLQPGDYVVHTDHGIGLFAGLARVEKNGAFQEVIRLTYQNNDTLLVSIHNLHKISKYRGKDGEVPNISKLGSVVWENMKKKTKSRVKDIARELIALYAKRKAETGFGFSPDSYLQQELEASFIYEDTPDQLKATQAIKEDMESLVPMDRLICGDVGFGKTEVAIRAAFKSAVDGKQVAVLVPTTILAMQHYYTFRNRLKDFPVRVDYISRFRKAKDQTILLKDLEDGKIDILIGTHRLIGKDVVFKDLGLLIVDEEQKFGVAVKEKLKSLKLNVDTLTLTATPIPRTLQFSMLGARDLSVINTPPPNRYPVLTEVHSFNPEIIRQAINYEMERNGQVFLIHNRVQNIYDIEAMVKKLCPKVKTIVGHGQMDGSKLEEVMLGFIQGDFDVLIATTIIESGLDIPNANTIIINDAQNFGLSDLHQLRGRVGRSNKKAFCYLMSPPLHSLPADARRRLKAIEEFSELGSGFQIAMQDLDIRGAGNLLGGEQSGFINEIGLETYQKILDEAMLELKETEFADLFPEEKLKEPHQKKFIQDSNIETDLPIHFPDTYIQNVAERLRLYRELDKILNEPDLQVFESQLIDRFGKLPSEAADLLQVVRLRWLAIELGMEKLILKGQKMLIYFIQNQDSAYYQSPAFSKVLHFVQRNVGRCRMKENNDKLTLAFDQVKTVKQAIHLLQQMAGGE